MNLVRRSSIASLSVVLSAVAFAQNQAIAPRVPYTIEALSANASHPDLVPYGLSQDGKITGITFDPITADIHAFILDEHGVFQDLGMFGYPYGADGIAINDSGQVAGTGYGPGYHAVLYSNGTVKKLGSIDGGSSQGYSINAHGAIVGRAINGDGGGQGFTYIGGQFNALAVDKASAINDSDDYVGSVGYYWTYGGYVHGVEHAFLFSNGVLTDLGSIGGGPKTASEAKSLNNAGQVTGYSTAADGTQHAFLYTGGTLYDLGTFAPYYTTGVSINARGQIVGNITTAYGGQVGAFVYSGGVLKNLLELLGPCGAAWSQLTVAQINDAGWIVGTGVINGATQGFLAKPKKP